MVSTSPSSDPLPASPPASYDLAAREEPHSLTLVLDDRGVMLDAGRISWPREGETRSQALADIRDIHLRVDLLKGDALPVCSLTFADGTVVRILAATRLGFPNPDLRRDYADFLFRLHAGLDADSLRRIHFHCGVSEGREMLFRAFAIGGAVLTVVVAAFGVATGIKGILLAVATGVGSWRMWTRANTNAPADYDPDSIPEAMVPAP